MDRNIRQIRRDQRTVLNALLPGHGFEVDKDRATRVAGENIQRIEIQRSASSHGYYLNLFWHYASLPGLLNPKSQYEPRSLTELDFLYTARVQTIDEQGVPQQLHSYLGTAELEQTVLGSRLQQALQEFSSAKHLVQPVRLVRQIPPELIAERIRRVQSAQNPVELRRRDPIDIAMQHWECVSMFALASHLATVARADHNDVWHSYSSLAISYARTDSDLEVLRILGLHRIGSKRR